MRGRTIGLIALAAVGLVVLALVTKSRTAQPDHVALRMTVLSGQASKSVQAAWEEYHKHHPEVHLELEVQSDENNFRSTAPATIFNSDGGPDLSWWWCSKSYQWDDMIDAGLLAPLDEIWDGNFSQASVAFYTHADGHKYGVHNALIWSPYVYYNKKIFADLGVAPPKTWDELYAVSDKARAAGYQPIVSNFDWNLIQVLPDALLMRAFSKDEYAAILSNWSKAATPAQKAVKWTDPHGLAVFQKLKEIADRKLLADGFAGASDIQVATSLFTSGKAAMYQNGSWDANGNLAGGGFEVGYFYYPPLGPQSFGSTGSFPANCYIAFKRSKQLGATKAFIKYLMSREGLLVAAKASGAIPTRTDFSTAETAAMFKPLMAQMLDDGTKLVDPPLFEAMVRSDLADEFKRITGEVLNNVTSPDAAATRLQALWEKARAE